MVHVLIILCHKNEKLYATKSFLIVLTDICPSLNLAAMKLHIFILTSLLSRNFLFKKKLFKWKDLMMFVYSSRDFDGDDDDGFDSVNKVERWEEWDDNRISSWCHWRAKAVENSLQICNVSFFFSHCMKKSDSFKDETMETKNEEETAVIRDVFEPWKHFCINDNCNTEWLSMAKFKFPWKQNIFISILFLYRIKLPSLTPYTFVHVSNF